MARPLRVRIQNRQRSLKTDARGIRALVTRVLEGECAATGLVGIVLLRDAAMAELNLRYRGRSGPTDVLSFPAETAGWPAEEPAWLGEVVVSVDRARAQAAERRLRARDELRRLIVHGVLHLCGYRDDLPRRRARMRSREDHYLRPSRRR
jgi:rRNA maturation RNase YbeY